MKRSKKVTIGILIFFVIVATVIGGRTAMGVYFKKKFGKRPPPGVVVEIVQVKEFSKTNESYCTALSSKTTSFKIKKSELLEPLKFKAAKKGEIIAKLQDKNIIAHFSGTVGPRGISVKAKFLAYKDKLYNGVILSRTSRVDAQTRSILARAQINNKDLEILPGSLLDIELLYDEKEAISVVDTSIIFEDEKKFVYKILENNKIQKTEVTTGIRKDGNLEIIEGINTDDKIVKEGLTRLADGMVVRPILK